MWLSPGQSLSPRTTRTFIPSLTSPTDEKTQNPMGSINSSTIILPPFIIFLTIHHLTPTNRL